MSAAAQAGGLHSRAFSGAPSRNPMKVIGVYIGRWLNPNNMSLRRDEMRAAFMAARSSGKSCCVKRKSEVQSSLLSRLAAKERNLVLLFLAFRCGVSTPSSDAVLRGRRLDPE